MQAGEIFSAVVFADGVTRYMPLAALERVPETPETLEQRLRRGLLVGPDWLRRTLMRYRVTGRLSDVVYSMEATDTDFFAHQFKPLLKLLNSPTEAILIADEVGLGKTIEAGLIWTELRARNDARRLLVICPKTLCEKWKAELGRRFGVEAKVSTAGELYEILTSSQSQSRGFAVIASMSALRPPKGWDSSEDDDGSAKQSSVRAKLARLLQDKAEGDPLFDLLVIDEAHHMRNPETLIHALANLANGVSAHRVFLSATPIHLQNRDLYSLLRLIDPDTFSAEDVLKNIINANVPIVTARELVLRQDSTREDIVKKIEEAQAHPLLAENRSLSLIHDQVKASTLDRGARSAIAWRLENANQLANFISRTRRRDVEEFRVVREAKSVLISMDPIERDFYDSITRLVENYARQSNTNVRFLLSSAQRMLASSPAAASNYWTAKGRSTMVDAEVASDIDEAAEIELDDRPLVSVLAAAANKLAMTDRLRIVDTKYRGLFSQLRRRWADNPSEKLIIFSSFKPTLEYLRERLVADRVKCVLLHGSISESRETALARFQEDPETLVLLSSEVGSEGIDLQFCSVVVNYDLPWNPMRIEQRIGRVDRLGQKSKMVHVLSMLYANTIDERLYSRLYHRLDLIQQALGGFEATLGETVRDLTIKLFDPNLSEEQKNAVIEQTAQALETKRRHEEALESEAGSFIAHGDYILNRILESRELKRWIQGEDILAYVKDRLVRSYPGVVIEASRPGAYTQRIHLTAQAQADFNRFLSARSMKGVTRLSEGGDRAVYRFTSSVTQRVAPGEENVSLVHPLVKFAAELDERDESAAGAEPVGVRLELSALDLAYASEISEGIYVLGVRHWVLSDENGRATGNARLAYSGCGIEKREIIRPEVAEAIVAACVERAYLLPNASNHPQMPIAADVYETRVAPDLVSQFNAFVLESKAEIEDRVDFQKNSLERHVRNRLETINGIRERFEKKAEVNEFNGDRRNAQRFRALASAQQKKIARLEELRATRAAEIEARRAATPIDTDVTAIFVILI